MSNRDSVQEQHDDLLSSWERMTWTQNGDKVVAEIRLWFGNEMAQTFLEYLSEGGDQRPGLSIVVRAR